MVRVVTDIWWVASPKVREKAKGQISRLYYTILALVTAWSCFAVLSGEAMALFKFLGFIANLVLAVSALQILIVNTTLLPKELRPSWIRRAALLGCVLFYSVFFILMATGEIRKLLS
jgi:cytochrome b561